MAQQAPEVRSKFLDGADAPNTVPGDGLATGIEEEVKRLGELATQVDDVKAAQTATRREGASNGSAAPVKAGHAGGAPRPRSTRPPALGLALYRSALSARGASVGFVKKEKQPGGAAVRTNDNGTSDCALKLEALTLQKRIRHWRHLRANVS
jgi:hypothetical protein